MRILHFADLHIGVESFGRTDPETGLSTRLLDFLAAFDEVVDYALANNVDLVLLAGDAYKSRDPSQTHQRALAQRLARLSSANIPVFLLVGNHDLPHAVSRANAIDIFQTLQVPNLYVADTLDTYHVDTPSGPLQVVALPWPRHSQLLAHDGVRGMSIDQINEEIQSRLSNGIRGAADNLDPAIPAILTAHVTVSGSTLGSERSMMLGQDHYLLPSSLHLPAFDYIALGHIHKHQVLRENPTMAYAGSLQRVDFGEEGDPKGFCVVDLDPDRMQGMRMVDFQFQHVKARNFVTVNVNVPDGAEDPTLEVVHAILRHHVAEAIVRVRISLTAEQSTALRESEVREALKEAHYVASIQRQVEEERRTRLPGDTVEGLDPIKALDLYLQSRKTASERREKLLLRARQLMAEDETQEQEDAPLTTAS